MIFEKNLKLFGPIIKERVFRDEVYMFVKLKHRHTTCAYKVVK